MSFPPIIFDIIRWLTMLILFGGVVAGLGIGCLFLTRRARANRWTNLLFALLLLSFSLTLLDKFFTYSSWASRHSKLASLPIYLSFALGPLLFFYVKSRLYPQHFKMKKADFKHFILPTVQFVLLSWVGVQDANVKSAFQTHFFSPFYGNFEKAVFMTQFFLYLYFSYRFVLHEKESLSIKAKTGEKRVKNPDFRRQILVVGWLKRMVKVLFIIFGVHAVFILMDYFSYKIFDVNLQTKALFPAFYELSFEAMLLWLILNAFFAWRRGL